LPFPIFGMGGPSGAESDQSTEAQGDGSMPPPPPPPSPTPTEPNTNEWGDPWLSDEQAGVSNPDDNSGFLDTLSDFFRDD
jgi:hypothetical protein